MTHKRMGSSTNEYFETPVKPSVQLPPPQKPLSLVSDIYSLALRLIGIHPKSVGQLIQEYICARMVDAVEQQAIYAPNKLPGENRCRIYLSPVEYDRIQTQKSPDGEKIEKTLCGYLKRQILTMYENRLIRLPLQMLVELAPPTWGDYAHIGTPYIKLENTIQEDFKKIGVAHLICEPLGIDTTINNRITELGRGDFSFSSRVNIPNQNSMGSYMTISRDHAFIEFTGEDYYFVHLSKNSSTYMDDYPEPLQPLKPFRLGTSHIFKLGEPPHGSYQQAVFQFKNEHTRGG